MVDAAHIAQALAGARHPQRLPDGSWLIPCPAPSHGRGHGDRHPGLRISDGDTRLLVHCFSGCPASDVLDALRHRGLLDDNARAPAARPARCERSSPSPAEYERRQRDKARWLWRQRLPIAGTCAERYLRQVRGYSGTIPATLGFLAPTQPGHHPAMVAPFDIPPEFEPGVLGKPYLVGAVHLTLLRSDGRGKADIERPTNDALRPLGRPIVLAPANDLLGLVITEGVEDALTAHQATGLGAWAAGAAGFMPALAATIPASIECITIYAHPDKAGQDGARGLAEALAQRGIQVRIEGIPP